MGDQLMDSENMGDQSSGGETLHTPNVAFDYKPHKRQEFDNLEEAFAFYNKYAKGASFSVKIHSNRRSKDNNNILRKEYVCFRKGKSLQSSACVGSGLKRCRPIVPDGCGAKLALVKSKLGKYMVRIFVRET